MTVGAVASATALTLGGLADRDRWPDIQAAMINAMVRLEKALKPQVKRLRV